MVKVFQSDSSTELEKKINKWMTERAGKGAGTAITNVLQTQSGDLVTVTIFYN